MVKKIRTLQQKIAAWLQTQNIHYTIVKYLSSNVYADASHFTAESYKLITNQFSQIKLLQNLTKEK